MAKSTNDSVMRDALERFAESQETSSFNREDFYNDTKFARLSLQWPDDVLRQRQQEGRPALVINKLSSLIRAVVNEARQNNPSIKVSPVDNFADEDTAEVIGGLIRNIERQSNAGIAYDTAIDNAVTGGFGFFRIDIDYAHDQSFDLEARIRRIPNPLSVHWDTSSTQFDASDWDYAFISDMMSKDEYRARYPKGSLVSFEGDSRDDYAEMWLQDDQIRVAEWFQRVRTQEKLLQISYIKPQSGQPVVQAVRESSLPNMAKAFFKAGNLPVEGIKDSDLVAGFIQTAGIQIIRERMVDGYEIKRRIINGTEVLEEDEWPGQSIPVCPVWGDEVFLDGRRHFRSLIRDAKDPQMMFNFWRSATTELVALAPRAPWVGPKGFVPKGQENKWASANTRSHAYLEFEGSQAPQRQAFAGVPSGALNEATMAAMDMNDITGIYPSALGARSNETSGRAIMARERQGDVNNFHFIDNLNRAISYAGKVLVEIIPAVYSPKETIRILGEDNTAKVVQLTMEDGGTLEPGVNGQQRLYNLAVGKYDVDVKTGPSFATQREETRETLIEIMRQVPNAAPFIGDVLLDHMNFVGADKVAKRLKALLPPEVRQAEEAAEGSDNPELAAERQKNVALRQQMQQAQQAVMQEIEKIKAEKEAISQSKQIDMMKAQADAAAKMKELELKERDMALKEMQAMQPKQDDSTRLAFELELQRERLEFEAAERQKDREAEFVKLIMQKTPDMAPEDAQEEASREVSQITFQRDEMGNIIGAMKVEGADYA